MASGEMTSPEFVSFLQTAFRNMADHAMDGSIHYICGADWPHGGRCCRRGMQCSTNSRTPVVWAKDNGGMGTFYRSRHELVFVFKLGTKPPM